jgi:leucyl aminopeptidase
MEVRVVQGSITDVESDVLIVNLFDGVTVPGGATGAVDQALGGIISDLIAAGEISGKVGKTTLIHTAGKIAPKRVLVVGLGKSEEFDLRAARNASGYAFDAVKDKGFKSATTIVQGSGIAGLPSKDAARMTVEGALLALYRSDLYKKADESRKDIVSVTIVEHDAGKIPAIEEGVKAGKILSDAMNEVRTMGNEPANLMTPTELANRAIKIAEEFGLEIEILDKDRMVQQGMSGLLAVASASVQPPKFIVIRYNVGKDRPTVAFVGKAITFDSGGLDLKSGSYMLDMKLDMVGGAAVIESMQAIAQFKPNINVIGIVPATENMISGSSYKMRDIISYKNGKNVEVMSTDAEGRLILADGMLYALEQKVEYLIDICTLTGGVVTALGHDISGLMGNNPELMSEVKRAAETAAERMWELPLPKDYMETIKSDIADFTNGGGRAATAIQGGLFLQEFAGDTPWVHIDIAGTGDTSKDGSGAESYIAPGATGVGVRTLVALAMQLGAK